MKNVTGLLPACLPVCFENFLVVCVWFGLGFFVVLFLIIKLRTKRE